MTSLIFQLSRDYLTQEYVEQFMEMAAAFKVEWLILVDPGGHAERVRNIRPGMLQFIRADSLQTALAITDGVPVYLDESSDRRLEEFMHPRKATYILGDDAGRLEIPDRATSVKIETLRPGHLWSQQAAAIVLHDRLIKSL